jgi:hypothetical protein
MYLDSKYYSYCKELGVMKENYNSANALETLKREVNNTKTADPAFKRAVSALTMSSPEVSIRACMIYRYDIELNYVVGGNIKHGRLADFGQCGVHEHLQITKYKDQGNYTVLKDFSSLPYTLYNDRNVFPYDAMKNALKDVINKQVPRGTTSYESTDWSVSCYAVPVLVAIVKHSNGKTYYLSYNLHNGHYHWEWPDDPALLDMGKKAGKFNTLARLGGIALSVIGIISAISAAANSTYAGFNPAPFLFAIIAFIVAYKTKKSKGFFDRYFIKNPSKKLVNALTSAIVVAVLGFLAFVTSFLG